MCAFDWPLLNSIIAASGALANAGLLYWMIRVTQRYVNINAQILTQAVASAETAARQEQMTSRLFSDQLQQRLGPIIVSIEEIDGRLLHWEHLLSEVVKNRSNVLVTSEQLWSPDIDVTIRASGTLSLAAARQLSFAAYALRRLDLEIAEVRRRLREEDPSEIQDIAADVTREVLPLINESRAKFGIARYELERLTVVKV